MLYSKHQLYIIWIMYHDVGDIVSFYIDKVQWSYFHKFTFS